MHHEILEQGKIPWLSEVFSNKLVFVNFGNGKRVIVSFRKPSFATVIVKKHNLNKSQQIQTFLFKT